jgi:hypothetical protein
MYGRPGLLRRRPLLRAAAVGGTFAAGRATGRRAAEQAGAATYRDRDQRISDIEGQQHAPLLRAGGEGQQSQSLLRATPEGQQQPLLRATPEGQQQQPLLRAAGRGQQQPLLRTTGTAQQHQPLMQAPRPDMGPASAADQLSRLAELHLQGELTDDEFAAAKALTLGRS